MLVRIYDVNADRSETLQSEDLVPLHEVFGYGSPAEGFGTGPSQQEDRDEDFVNAEDELFARGFTYVGGGAAPLVKLVRVKQ